MPLSSRTKLAVPHLSAKRTRLCDADCFHRDPPLAVPATSFVLVFLCIRTKHEHKQYDGVVSACSSRIITARTRCGGLVDGMTLLRNHVHSHRPLGWRMCSHGRSDVVQKRVGGLTSCNTSQDAPRRALWRRGWLRNCAGLKCFARPTLLPNASLRRKKGECLFSPALNAGSRYCFLSEKSRCSASE